MSKVSVIIPTHNNENDIERCINSILDQTYKNYEIIIVDDYSTDNTLRKLNFLYGNIKNIKILKNNENMKAAYTRNKALEHAGGDYIAIQDADDYSSRYRLAKQVEFLDNNLNYDFVGSNSSSFDNKGIWKRTRTINSPTVEDFVYRSPFVHASIMFRKEVLKEMNGYRVSKETERGQDYDLLYRLYKSGYQGYNLEDYLYFYQEDIETIKKRTLVRRIESTKNKLRYFEWSKMSFREKIKIIRTILMGFIPAKITFKIMKYRSRKSLYWWKDEDNENK